MAVKTKRGAGPANDDTPGIESTLAAKHTHAATGDAAGIEATPAPKAKRSRAKPNKKAATTKES